MTSYDDREQDAFDRTVRLFQTTDPALRVGDGTWNAHDVLAHLVTVARRYTSIPRLADTPRDVDVINAEELAELRDLDVPVLLEQYRAAFAAYREVWTAMDPSHVWPFHGGGRIATTPLRANWLGEMLVHGYDVAAAGGVPWSIQDEDAADLLAFLRDILPTYSRPGEEAAVEVAAVGLEPWTLRTGSQGARPEPAGGADARIEAPPELLVLLFYQRVTPREAVSRGVRITGREAVLDAVISCLERP